MITHGKDFEILSFRKNNYGTSDTSLKPYSIRRVRDKEIFTIGDFVTNGTQMRGRIRGFELLGENIFVSHTWSGIGMNLDSLSKILEDDLPSQFQLNQVVIFGKNEECKLQYATIRGVHFYRGTVKYDLGLWIGDGSIDNPEKETRIYNVDEEVLTPA